MLLRSADQFTRADVETVLGRAEALRDGAAPSDLTGTVVGLVFLDTSLRTRVGFAAAAARLGAHSIEVTAQRSSEVSMPEAVDDTIRTVAAYADITVVRLDKPLTGLPDGVGTPVVNGGDRGPLAEHPTQALIDLFALRGQGGLLEESAVALCGDLRMRAVRSLLTLLARNPPRRLQLVTEPGLEAGFELPPALATVVEHRTLDDLADTDVLYLAGIPHGALDEDGRSRLRLTRARIAALAPGCAVLSPMPLIDEIERDVLGDPRMRMFQQSADGLFVRMALLEHLLGQRIS